MVGKDFGDTFACHSMVFCKVTFYIKDGTAWKLLKIDSLYQQIIFQPISVDLIPNKRLYNSYHKIYLWCALAVHELIRFSFQYCQKEKVSDFGIVVAKVLWLKQTLLRKQK